MEIVDTDERSFKVSFRLGALDDMATAVVYYALRHISSARVAHALAGWAVFGAGRNQGRGFVLFRCREHNRAPNPLLERGGGPLFINPSSEEFIERTKKLFSDFFIEQSSAEGSTLEGEEDAAT